MVRCLCRLLRGTADTATATPSLTVILTSRQTSANASTVALRDSSGDITANFRGTAISAQYADIAEKYTTDQEYRWNCYGSWRQRRS